MGFPSPAADYMEDRLDLNKIFVPNPLSTFYFRNKGNSMVSAFIPPGSLLVVDRSVNPSNNDIVVAFVNGEFTVRYLIRNSNKGILRAANSKIPDINITNNPDAVIWGKVTAVIIDKTT